MLAPIAQNRCPKSNLAMKVDPDSMNQFPKKPMPYGLSSFKRIKETGKFYVDNTKFIEILEENYPYSKIWRMRRMGKSLFCNTLDTYYDCNTSEEEVITIIFKIVLID